MWDEEGERAGRNSWVQATLATPALPASRTDDRNAELLHSNVNRRPTNDELRTTARSRSSAYQESCRVTKGVSLRSGGAGRCAPSGGAAFGSGGRGGRFAEGGRGWEDVGEGLSAIFYLTDLRLFLSSSRLDSRNRPTAEHLVAAIEDKRLAGGGDRALAAEAHARRGAPHGSRLDHRGSQGSPVADHRLGRERRLRPPAAGDADALERDFTRRGLVPGAHDEAGPVPLPAGHKKRPPRGGCQTPPPPPRM